MKLSIVTTLYRSESYIVEFYNRMEKATKGVADDVEYIFVNDGSPDDSLIIATDLMKIHKNIKIIDLSRNFGHHKAIMTGLQYANGDHIFLIDVDLEEQPEDFNKLWEDYINDEVDVVFGIQRARKGKLFERISGWLFYAMFNLLADIKITPNITTMRVMSARYVKALLEFKEHELLLGAVMVLAGFRQKALVVEKLSRLHTSYTLCKKIKIAIDGIAAFSMRPLLFLFYLGLLITGISLAGSAYIIVNKLLYGYSAGWSSVIVSVWAVGGILVSAIGVVGIYLATVFREVKKRPNTIIRQIYT